MSYDRRAGHGCQIKSVINVAGFTGPDNRNIGSANGPLRLSLNEVSYETHKTNPQAQTGSLNAGHLPDDTEREGEI